MEGDSGLTSSITIHFGMKPVKGGIPPKEKIEGIKTSNNPLWPQLSEEEKFNKEVELVQNRSIMGIVMII